MTHYHQRLQAGEFAPGKPTKAKPKTEPKHATAPKPDAEPTAKDDAQA